MDFFKHIKYIIYIIPFIISNNAYCQNDSNVFGKITDNTSGLAIQNVEIVLQPSNKGSITDNEGNYSIKKIIPGKYTVVFKHLGYETVTKSIVVKNDQNIKLDIRLIPKYEMLHEVIIKEKKQEQLSYNIDQINRMEIRQSNARDVGGFLRNVPNLSGIRKGSAGIDPVVRGFKFNQVNVIINGGIKIEGGCPNRMDPAVSHIDINDIDNMKVIKGPYALRYGPNFGGVINIKTIYPLPYKEFKVHVNAINSFESNWKGNKEHLSVMGGNRTIQFSISGNHEKYGDYKAGNGKLVNANFERYNYTTQLGFSPSDNHYLHMSFDRSYGRNVMFPALPMDERSDDTKIYSLEYSVQKISKLISAMSLKLYRSEVHHIMDNKERPFSDTVVAVSDIRAYNQGGRLEAHLKPGKNEFIIGADYENISKDGERTKHFILQPNLPVKMEDLWKNAKIANTGIFLIWNRKINNFSYNASARLDLNEAVSDTLQLKNMSGEQIYSNDDVDSKFVNFSISAGALYDINRNISTGISLGRGVRSPDMVERFIVLLPVGYDNYDYLGNPDLEPEVNNEIDLKFNITSENLGNIKTNGFFSYVTNYITGKEVPPSQVKPQTKDVVGVKKFYNADYVYLYGFEFLYSSPYYGNFGFSATVAATYGINPSAIKYVVEEGQVVGEEEVKNDPLPEIPPLESNLNFRYKFFNNKLTPSLSIRLVAPQNRTSEVFYEKSTAGFVITDFKVEYKYNHNLSVNAGINNIFDIAYYEHLNRRIIGSNNPLYEPGRIFFVNLIFNI